jgi:hypothetical protein
MPNPPSMPIPIDDLVSDEGTHKCDAPQTASYGTADLVAESSQVVMWINSK